MSELFLILLLIIAALALLPSRHTTHSGSSFGAGRPHIVPIVQGYRGDLDRIATRRDAMIGVDG